MSFRGPFTEANRVVGGWLYRIQAPKAYNKYTGQRMEAVDRQILLSNSSGTWEWYRSLDPSSIIEAREPRGDRGSTRNRFRPDLWAKLKRFMAQGGAGPQIDWEGRYPSRAPKPLPPPSLWDHLEEVSDQS